MFDHSELTVVKNSAGMPTALGYPVNSTLLQSGHPPMMFMGGGKEQGRAFSDQLAVPAGLVCRTETICTGSNSAADPFMEDENEVVPDGLYERLMELAEITPAKKMTRRRNLKSKSATKPKTRKRK
jgi:hypothetical protein